jgi:hypothetical protein
MNKTGDCAFCSEDETILDLSHECVVAREVSRFVSIGLMH